MRTELLVAAMLIFGFASIRAEEPDSTGDASTEEPASDTISAEPVPAPSARPARTPFSGQRTTAPRPQAQSSGAPSPEPSGSPAAAPEPEDSPEPAPSTYHPSTRPPAGPPSGGSRAPMGKIGSAWTPEGTGIPTLDAEYKKQQAAIKAGQAACQQKTQAAIANGKPREATGYPTDAQKAAAMSLMQAESAADRSFSVYPSYIYEMMACGATPAGAIKAWKDAALVAGHGDLKAGYWELNTGSHNTAGGMAAQAYCGGYAFGPMEDCYRYPFGHTAITCSFDAAENLRRASFGTDARGLVPAPFTAAWSDPNGQAVFNRPAIDMHKELRDRLAYFDRIKGDLQEDGYDPQLVYVKIMTGELIGKCQSPDPSKPMDPACGHFNGGGMTSDSAMLGSFKGKTLAQVASQRFSGCGDSVYVPGR